MGIWNYNYRNDFDAAAKPFDFDYTKEHRIKMETTWKETAWEWEWDRVKTEELDKQEKVQQEKEQEEAVNAVWANDQGEDELKKPDVNEKNGDQRLQKPEENGKDKQDENNLKSYNSRKTYAEEATTEEKTLIKDDPTEQEK